VKLEPAGLVKRVTGRVTRRNALVAAGALVLALLAWAVFRPEAVRVEAAEVTRGPLRVTVDEEGETRVRERYVVAAPTTGRLLRIALDEGDRVEAGDLVARIAAVPLDPRDRAAAQARLEAAEARKSEADVRVGLARSTLDQSRRSAERAERLRAAGTLSAEALEEAQLALTRARREADAARESASAAAHEVEVARAALIAARTGASAASDPAPDPTADPGCATGPCIEVRAPVAGSVLRVLEESERIVLAGAPLVEIGDPARLEIVVDVLSTDAVRIRPGADVWIEQWGGDRPLRAKVRRIEPSAFTKVSALGVEEQRVNVLADLLEGAEGLGDGYRVEARIVVWESPEVLRVPASALFRAGEAWAVFAVENGRARQREIELGERGSAQAEVRGHLVEGERVILHPSDRLADGARVEVF
jgi:HlyD family secretion protein